MHGAFWLTMKFGIICMSISERGIKGHDEKFIVDKVSVEFGRIYIADLND